jgi:uncharacterized protein YdbL (DUF1318 family)
MKKLLAMMAMVLVSSQLWAIDLNSAKQQGLIGERADGYLGYVKKPPSSEVKTLVQEINNRRKASYQKIAQKNNLSSEKVSLLAGKKTFSKTKPGNYYQAANGAWLKK